MSTSFKIKSLYKGFIKVDLGCIIGKIILFLPHNSTSCAFPLILVKAFLPTQYFKAFLPTGTIISGSTSSISVVRMSEQAEICTGLGSSFGAVHFINDVKYTSLLTTIPLFSNNLFKLLQTLPLNCSPLLSSSSPGQSCINIILADVSPTPNKQGDCTSFSKLQPLHIIDNLSLHSI